MALAGEWSIGGMVLKGEWSIGRMVLTGEWSIGGMVLTGEWSIGGMVLTGEADVLGGKPDTVPLCTSQISKGLVLDRTRSSAKSGWRLLTSAVSRPIGDTRLHTVPRSKHTASRL